MRKPIAFAAAAALIVVAGCDDGRQERIPGAVPAGEVPEATEPWDTLHPPVPPAPGVEGTGTTPPPPEPAGTPGTGTGGT